MPDSVGEGFPARATSITTGQEGGQSAWTAARTGKDLPAAGCAHSLSGTWDQDASICTPHCANTMST